MKSKWLILSASLSVTALFAEVHTSIEKDFELQPSSIVIGTDDDDYYVDPPEMNGSDTKPGLSPAQKAMKKNGDSSASNGKNGSSNDASSSDDSDDEDTDNEED
jgi:hypothetical protein